MSLALIGYQGRDWHGHVRVEPEMPEFFPISLTCDSDTSLTVDVSLHVARKTSCLLLSLFSPYWIINKTSRVLQYRAEDVSVKHPADYRDIVLFSFKKKSLFSKSKVRHVVCVDVCERPLILLPTIHSTSCSSSCASPPAPGLTASLWTRWGVTAAFAVLPTPWISW